MFPDKKDAPSQKTWLDEMSEGVEVLAKRGAAAAPVDPDETEGENPVASSEQGCQIFLGATYQNRRKFTKCPYILQTSSFARPSK
jgi:hypothetical protein